MIRNIDVSLNQSRFLTDDLLGSIPSPESQFGQKKSRPTDLAKKRHSAAEPQ